MSSIYASDRADRGTSGFENYCFDRRARPFIQIYRWERLALRGLELLFRLIFCLVLRWRLVVNRSGCACPMTDQGLTMYTKPQWTSTSIPGLQCYPEVPHGIESAFTIISSIKKDDSVVSVWTYTHIYRSNCTYMYKHDHISGGMSTSFEKPWGAPTCLLN